MISDAAEQSKFETIYHAYRHTMLYAATQVLHDHHLAEDAVQEAFSRIIDQLEKINEKDCHKTKAFLVIIVKNTAINLYNKRKKQDETVLFEDATQSSVLYDPTEEDDDVQQIVRCINKLPELYAHSMTLRYLYEFSDKECAQLLKLSEAALRKRLERGRKLLKELLEKEGADYAV